MNSILKYQIDEKLVDFLVFVCQNPLIFVSETDLHVILIRELMKIDELNPNSNSGLYDTGCTIGQNRKTTSSTLRYKTTLIHKEYGMGGKSRGDIVILSEEDVHKIKDPINLKIDPKSNKWLIPEYIFEFGTEKAAQDDLIFEDHIVKDSKKVVKAKACGYIIHIHRNFIHSAYYTERGKSNFAKFKSFAEKITNQAGLLRAQDRSVFIIIDIGNESRIVGRKIRIYDKNMRKFIGVNMNSIRTEFEKILK
jgi:hypothetical protein